MAENQVLAWWMHKGVVSGLLWLYCRCAWANIFFRMGIFAFAVMPVAFGFDEIVFGEVRYCLFTAFIGLFLWTFFALPTMKTYAMTIEYLEENDGIVDSETRRKYTAQACWAAGFELAIRDWQDGRYQKE